MDTGSRERERDIEMIRGRNLIEGNFFPICYSSYEIVGVE